MSDSGRQAATQAGSQAGAGTIRSYRNLVAWRRGMELAEVIYTLTRAFPDTEKFGLVSQMRRAAVSIPSNVAEGFARQSLGDYLKHLRIARGSLAELSTQIDLATRVGLAKPDPELLDLAEEEARILNALIRSLERRESAQ